MILIGFLTDFLLFSATSAESEICENEVLYANALIKGFGKACV